MNLTKSGFGWTTGTVGGRVRDDEAIEVKPWALCQKNNTNKQADKTMLFFENGLLPSKVLFIKSNLNLRKCHRKTNQRQSTGLKGIDEKPCLVYSKL